MPGGTSLSPSQRVVYGGVAVLGWLGVGLSVVAYLANHRSMQRPATAAITTVVAGLLVATYGMLLPWRPMVLTRWPFVFVGVRFAACASVAEGWAFGPAQAYRPPLLVATTVIAVVILAGFSLGWPAGIAAGLVVGVARWAGALAPDLDPSLFFQFFRRDYPKLVPLASVVVLYVTAGAAAGFLRVRLREAEREVADARLREQLTRRLHDTVLQTLALVQRRTEDPVLAGLARDQERDLRQWLFAAAPHSPTDLVPGLRAAAGRFENHYGGQADVIVATDLEAPQHSELCDALIGAVGEALTNAGKHGAAQRVTVYVEPADEGGVFCSVHDDGTGFDLSATPEGVGLSRSIRGRLADVGGRVEVNSAPGQGTEVRLWLPA